jgi:hypothetical protein
MTKLNSIKQKKIFVLRRKKSGRIDSWRTKGREGSKEINKLNLLKLPKFKAHYQDCLSSIKGSENFE